MQYREGFFKGRHAELCELLASGSESMALNYIYSFFRGTDHNDTYSIELLTIMREILEDGESPALSRFHLRIRKSADKVLMNVMQFVYALGWCGKVDESLLWIEKIREEFVPFITSVRNYFAEEETKGIEMAGLRIREAFNMLALYCKEHSLVLQSTSFYKTNLELTQLFLPKYSHCISEDMLKVAKDAHCRGDLEETLSILHQLIDKYGYITNDGYLANPLSKEVKETVKNLIKAYEVLDNLEHDPKYEASIRELNARIAV